MEKRQSFVVSTKNFSWSTWSHHDVKTLVVLEVVILARRVQK
jgi:hypothetical protein